MDKKTTKKRLLILIILCIAVVIAFMSVWVYTYRNLINGDWSEPHIKQAIVREIQRRGIQLLAIAISVTLIAVSSLVFQTITNNRILTPNVLGFDAIYVITQTLLVAILGMTSSYVANEYFNFGITTVAMIGIVLLMYKLILKKNRNNIILLLLFGMVLSSFAGSVANFIQVYMNPEEFQSVISLTTVNINKINSTLVWVSLPIMILLIIMFIRYNQHYNVMSLGEDHAVNLGVDFNKKSRISLILIAVSVSISTALIGPLAFLGLIVVNGAKELFKTNKHLLLMLTSSLLAIMIVFTGQVVLELTPIKTPVSVIINFIGGLYMIYLVLKENKE